MVVAPSLFPVPPKIQRGPKLLKVQAGQRADLPCSAQGTPPPVITWFRGGSAVLVDGVQHVSHPGGMLSISQATLSDAGGYTCVAANIAGSDETELTLHVQGDLGPGEIWIWWRLGAGENGWRLCSQYRVLEGLGAPSEDSCIRLFTQL